MARGRGRVGGGRGRGRGRGRVHGANSPGAIANAQAGAEFNPGIHEARAQIKGSRKREGDLGSWYRQLAADYQGAQNQGSAALRSVEEATGKQLAEAGERSAADQSQLASSDAAFAKLTGGPQDAAGLSKIAAASAAAAKGRVEMAAPVEQTQANFVARLGSDKAAALLKGIESRTEERNRRGKLKSDLTAQRQEKGAARISAKSKILEAKAAQAAEARKLALEEQEARSAERQANAQTTLDQANLMREVREGRISNRQAQERIKIERKNAATSARSQRATANHYKQGGKDGGLSPGERNTNRKERQNAAALVHSAVTQAGPPKTKAEAAELERLAVEAGGAPREVHRAVQNLLNKAKARRGYNSRVKRGEVAGPPAPGR